MADRAQRLPVRALAALVVADVLAGSSLTDSLLKRNRLDDSRDRALVAELAYGACRWFFRLDALLQGLVHKPMKKRDADIHGLLLIGIYQLLYTRVPQHAAVAETAGAARALKKKWAVALINGVLRRLQREQEQHIARVLDIAEARYSQPAWFLQAVRSAWPGQWEAIVDALLERPPMTLRVNRQRSSIAEYQALLQQAGLKSSLVPGVPSALNLAHPIGVEQIPGFAEGLVSIQDAGAQIAAFLLQPEAGSHILDACAAPGGKTGHILEQAADLQVTALDVDAERLSRVAENMRRLRYQPRMLVGDAADPHGEWAGADYDRILLDVPCTATGVMRRHPDIRLLRRPSDVTDLVQRQAGIMAALWPRLKRGGRLLYATCSLLPEENELQIEKFVANNADCREIHVDDMPGVPRRYGIQILPGEQQMDGFYYALLEKA